MKKANAKIKNLTTIDSKSAEEAFAKAEAAAIASMETISSVTSSTADEFGSLLTKLPVADMALAAVEGIGALTMQSLLAGDELAKTADRLGMTTESLAGLRYAGQQTGVDFNTMDVATQNFTARLAEAAQGTGEANGALRALSLDAEVLSRMPVDQAMQEVAGAMSQVGSQFDKSRLAVNLFGSEGISLVRTLALGKEGMQASAKEADYLGIAINRVDAAKMELANKAMLKAESAVAGVGNSIASELAPWIIAGSNAFSDLARSGILSTKNIHSGITQVINVVGFLGDAVQTASYGFSKINLGWDIAKASVIEGIADVDGAIVNFIGNKPKSGSFFGDVFNNMISSIPVIGEHLDVLKVKNVDLHQSSTEAWAAVAKDFNSMDKILAAPMLSEKLQEVTTTMNDEAAKRAKIVEKARLAARLPANDDANLGTDPAVNDDANPDANPELSNYDATTQALINKTRERFESMRQIADENMMLEEEKAILKFDKDLEKLEYDKQQLIDNNAWNLEQQTLYEEAKNSVIADGENKISAIRDKAGKSEKDLEKKKNKALLSGAQSALGDMSSLMNSNSRAAFEVGKAAALANATISGISAAIAAWDAGMQVGGPYAPVVAVAYTAASLAKTGAMISSIASTSFGSKSASVSSGGGVPSVSGGSAGKSADSTIPSAPSQSLSNEPSQKAPVQQVSVSVEKGIYSSSDVRSLIEAINEETDNGVQLRVA